MALLVLAETSARSGGVAECPGSNPIQIPASYKQSQTYSVKLNEPLIPNCQACAISIELVCFWLFPLVEVHCVREEVILE